MIHVAICLANNRDRRRANADERARQLFASLKSYFMAQTFDGKFDLNETKTRPSFIRRLGATLRRWGRGFRQNRP
jgi:hypothetical protein